jgi:CO/xanthine dehydrogenase FAD-binding subunit
MPTYLRPPTLDAALEALAAAAAAPPADPADRLTILAGGTDLYPTRTAHAAWGRKVSRNVIDISLIPGLAGIRAEAGEIVIGAATTWSDLVRADLPAAFVGLKAAAREVGGVQIQNRGTIVGNICNASPAADGVPPLVALGAEVEIASTRGRRRLPLADFILGNRRTALASDEMLVAVRVPAPEPQARSVFLKLGARAYLVISIVSVAGVMVCDDQGRITSVAIAVGACSAAPLRLTGLEAALIGAPAARAAEMVTQAHLSALSPIDDVRASAAYRREAALTLVRRALSELAASGIEAAA